MDSFRVLFLQEGVLGGAVMGHASYQRSVRAELRRLPEIEARFAGLPAMGRSSRRLAVGWRVLGSRDLDLQTARWHAVQHRRARSVLHDELAEFPAQVAHVKSHSIAMGLVKDLDRVPIVPVVDATVWKWREMAIWRALRVYSRTMVRPSERMERRLFERAPLVIAMTEWAAESVLEVCPSANVVRHHPGINLGRFAPAAREPRDRLRVLFVGGRFEAKGGYDLLDALAPRLGRDVELDIVSADRVPEAEGVRVHRLSGADDRLVELYQQADVFCLPTYGDSNPWVILEAMGCATPVISTSIGAIPELIGGDAGLIVAPGDRKALAAALHELLDHTDTRLTMGKRGRERCEREYNASREVPLLFEHLRQAAGLGSPKLGQDRGGEGGVRNTRAVTAG